MFLPIKLNNYKKEKHSIIVLTLLYSLVAGCTQKIDSTNINFARFEDALARSGYNATDSINFIYWSKHSCHSCRLFSVKYLLSKPKYTVAFIVPTNFIDEVTELPKNQLYIDSLDLFGYKYFGISNIGIVKTFNKEVLSIKNFNPKELDLFASELE